MSENETPRRSKAEIRREIGASLLERRKARGLTLEKATQSLKMRVSYLEALEKGEWDELPGEVYARGFLKRYAQFLGLNGDKILADYLAATDAPGQRAEGLAPVPVGERTPVIWIWVGVGVLALIAIYNLARYERMKMALSDAPSPSAVVSPPASDLGPGPASSAQPPASAPGPLSAEPERHVIEIQSPNPLWLRVEAENRTFEGFIPQGSTWQWKGEGRFNVRLGHTREVRLRFDGTLVPLAENERRLTLPPDAN